MYIKINLVFNKIRIKCFYLKIIYKSNKNVERKLITWLTVPSSIN